MLKTLHIENYALIRETDISFDESFTVITGETGAGKSILLGALGLLLGQRADTQVLYDKERKCMVEATFDIAGLSLQPLFEQYDAEYDDLLILRREILPSAKSRAFVNDSPANLQFLKELAPHILDIHSQYQTLTLTESLFQTQLVDTFSDTTLLPHYQITRCSTTIVSFLTSWLPPTCRMTSSSYSKRRLACWNTRVPLRRHWVRSMPYATATKEPCLDCFQRAVVSPM